MTIRGRSLGSVVLGAVLSLVSGCSALPGHRAPVAAPVTPQAQVLVDGAATIRAASPIELVAAQVPSLEAAAPERRTLSSCMAERGGSLLINRDDPRVEKTVALTFDDGPHVTFTPAVLDLLAAHHVQATFFVVGRAINSHTYGLIQRTIAAGHTIGSHSYDHDVEMASAYGGEAGVEYIVGEHVTTQALVDLALVATSEDDFNALYTRVFDVQPFAWIMKDKLRTDHEVFAARTSEVLRERGVEQAHAYPIAFYRPPGGGTYLGSQDTPAAKRYQEALDRLGLVNVLWHGATGETEEGRAHDVGYQQSNMTWATRRGGVLLVHDAIEKAALARGLDQMEMDGVSVVSLESMARAKLGCE
ncbi:MAG: polysaccharide deacetylase family protein [Polyangiaceae bacterium]